MMTKRTISTVKVKSNKRGVAILCLFSSVACFLLFNIFNLGVIKHDYYKDKAFDELTTTSTLFAKRGNIYDNNLNLLATTKTSWRIFLSSRDIMAKNKKDGKSYYEDIAEGLSKIFSLDYKSFLNKIKNSKQLDITVKKSATEKEYSEVINLIKEKKLDGMINTEAQTYRYYPENTLCAHVLGFTGNDSQGLYGLEYFYNSVLSGKNGYYLYERDANGVAMPSEFIDYVEAEDGKSIVTTIDSYIQKELEGVLEEIRVNHSVQNRVAGIVMDTNTGAILGMATSSPFNPNEPFLLDNMSMQKLKNSGYEVGSAEYKKLKSELMQVMWSNKAVSETYEPGSTFKIITVSSGLDSGAAKMSDTFSCHGYHTVGGWRIKCHKVKGHGQNFPLSYGLQMSCNPTMMVLAERIGADRFYDYVEKFGYFEKSGIDLPSEARTIFHQKENIGPVELATTSFGQRFKVSIINHLTAIAAVANGGNLVTPYVVDKIVDSDGKILSKHKTEIKRRVISEKVALEVADVLEKGVSGNGGAKNAYVDGYLVAAKTGTSQKFDVLDQNGNSYLRIGSTVAFSPSNGHGVATIIVVDEPQSTVKYGSVVAAPYVSKLLSKVLPYLDYESARESTVETVENYVGMNVNSVIKILKEKNLKFEVVGDGKTVISQMPQANIDISKDNSCIYIYTEKKKDELIKVPNFKGMSPMDANILANNLGLNIHILGVTDLKSQGLSVFSQSVPYGDFVVRGTVIKITVLGPIFED